MDLYAGFWRGYSGGKNKTHAHISAVTSGKSNVEQVLSGALTDPLQDLGNGGVDLEVKLLPLLRHQRF